MKTTILLIATMLTATTVQADGFMDADTQRARTTEANGECEISIPLGANRQACVNAYLCSNYGDCEGEGMQPIEQLPGGGVYRDNVGGANNGN